jgi:hypothetical protein
MLKSRGLFWLLKFTTSGAFLNGKIYKNPEIYDTESGEKSNWPKPPVNNGPAGCMVPDGDSALLLFGGIDSRRRVYRYDLLSKTWKMVDLVSPVDVYYSGCLVIPGEIIVN